jgi:digeranylgeranylglycerophospholipid reductase
MPIESSRAPDPLAEAEAYRDELPNTCDVLVVGAGPAGLSAAIAAKESGAAHVVLLDGRDPWREPVSCAEGVREAAFLKWSPIDPKPWKRQQITGCIFGTEEASFRWESPENSGWIVDRSGFHAGLAARCRELGVVCHFRARVQTVGLVEADGFRQVIAGDEGSVRLKARRIIDASGPGSSIGRDEGMAMGKGDLETAAFALVEGLAQPVDAIQLWLHPDYSPGGYAWIFPRDERVANVGVVVGRGASISSRKGLEIFLETLSPGASKTAQIRGGAIPNGFGGGVIAQRGIFKAGDAAGMVNAISRGGIVESLCAGRLAGVHAVASLSLPIDAGRAEAAYRRDWMRAFGNRQRWASRLKRAIHRIPVGVLQATFRRLAKEPGGHITWPTAGRAMLGAWVASVAKAAARR